ncbi:hypothetical protein [Nocardia sp. NPDC057030]|uniref:hypothetical protein n=1 Tax=unclassified Nocardia TaxID=2637762 RepID=UPI00363FDD79
MTTTVIRVVSQTAKVRAQPVNPVVVTPGQSPRVLVAITQGPPGPQGPQGIPGEGVRVWGETPTGALNGVNTAFTTAYPYRATSTAVYLNGLREFEYIETDASTVTFIDPPLSTDVVAIDYAID